MDRKIRQHSKHRQVKLSTATDCAPPHLSFIDSLGFLRRTITLKNQEDTETKLKNMMETQKKMMETQQKIHDDHHEKISRIESQLNTILDKLDALAQTPGRAEGAH